MLLPPSISGSGEARGASPGANCVRPAYTIIGLFLEWPFEPFNEINFEKWLGIWISISFSLSCFICGAFSAVLI